MQLLSLEPVSNHRYRAHRVAYATQVNQLYHTDSLDSKVEQIIR